MSPERLVQAKHIFDQALELTQAHQRRLFVQKACAGDQDLESIIIALLDKDPEDLTPPAPNLDLAKTLPLESSALLTKAKRLHAASRNQINATRRLKQQLLDCRASLEGVRGGGDIDGPGSACGRTSFTRKRTDSRSMHWWKCSPARAHRSGWLWGSSSLTVNKVSQDRRS